jgi:alpha-D-xyloside xylohydrolase
LTEEINQRERIIVEKEKRVVLLPRSSWAGEQRNSAANWTGDIHQDWDTLEWQIEGLGNYSIAGLPYITTDVGGYFPAEVSESDKELFLRWFQWGTFCPIYRVHGVARPFPWKYGVNTEAIMKKFDHLRYRLLPYIYATAGLITQKGGFMMRPLVMDFQDDPKALDQWDEFMFGPSLLVCPVHKDHAESVAKLDQ